MKCDLCGQELANSEEIKGHKEQMHPMSDGAKPVLKATELMDKPGMSDDAQVLDVKGAAASRRTARWPDARQAGGGTTRTRRLRRR